MQLLSSPVPGVRAKFARVRQPQTTTPHPTGEKYAGRRSGEGAAYEEATGLKTTAGRRLERRGTQSFSAHEQ